MLESPQQIVKKGESVYRERFQEEYEKKYLGKFVTIDVMSGKAFIADTPEEAIMKAQTENPNGVFHLIKVGSPGVYRMGYSSGEHGNWLFGQ